jgi:hypothetical protein
MRTTLTIDDALMRKLRQVAVRRGIPLKELVNRTLRAGLESIEAPPKRRSRFRQRVHSMGQPRVDLDRALQTAAELENDEIQRKQALRK